MKVFVNVTDNDTQIYKRFLYVMMLSWYVVSDDGEGLDAEDTWHCAEWTQLDSSHTASCRSGSASGFCFLSDNSRPAGKSLIFLSFFGLLLFCA